MSEYFEEAKKKLVSEIPEYDSPDFKRMRNEIRKKLKRKESDLLILIRRLKILILGDWYTKGKKKLLVGIKNTLLGNGLYVETIDKYYDIRRKGGLSQIQILEECCINHQLIVFIDGEGKGTITEQNYLRDNYVLHGKIIFFIEESKFNRLKNNPSEYIKDFPTIITYRDDELLEKVLIYSRFRLYRLADIIQKQVVRGAGLHSPSYEPWKTRLRKRKHIYINPKG